MALQFGGPIGPFRDNVQQRDVPVNVFGTIEYMSRNPSSPELESWLQAQVLNAVRNVIGQKMASGELTFRHLGQGTGELLRTLPEIIAASGVAQQGIQIGGLTMRFGIDGHPPAGAAPQQQQPQQQQQYAVDARIDVGGLRINASSDKGLDTQGLQNQLKDKAKSQILWWGIGCGVLLFVGAFILGLGLYVWRAVATSMSATSTTSPRSAAAAKWDGKSAFSCGGNDAITITGVKASLSETAISAAGNCTLTLVNVDITAPTAIESTGNAQITVTGGSLNGAKFAVKADGLSKVTMTGTKVTGKTQAGSMAKITGP